MTDTHAANATRLTHAHGPQLAEEWEDGHRALAPACPYPTNPLGRDVTSSPR